MFSHGGATRAVYAKGSGPAVVVIAEMPGISPQVIGFADRVVALGCTALLPHLFGTPGWDPLARNRLTAALHTTRTMLGACVSREFTVLATGRSSPIVAWLRALAADAHDRCGGPGVGVGMCFTGGYALVMAVDDPVLAPVLSQPSLPLPLTPGRRRSIDCSHSELTRVAGRCARDGLQVLGLRFRGDPWVPEQRFALLRERLKDGFIAVEIDQADGNPNGPLPRHHSVLTADLIDAPGEPTRNALDTALGFLRRKLLPA
jgi:dienelactone hydrolase